MIRIFKIVEDDKAYCINVNSDFDANRCLSLGYEEVPQEDVERIFGDKASWASEYTTSIVDEKIIFNPPEGIDALNEQSAFDNMNMVRAEKLAEYDRNVNQLQRKFRQAKTPEDKAKLEKQITLWDKYADMLCELPEKDGAPWDGDINKIPWPKMPVKK